MKRADALQPGVTIDDRHSTDLDDALWAEPLLDGSTRVTTTVALASRVELGSPIDQAARARVETHYHAAGRSSMLPRGLEERFSLLPGVERTGFAIEMLFGAQGEQFGETQIEERPFRSAGKLAYQDIPKILSEPGHVLYPVLRRLSDLASLLAGRRRESGAFVLYDRAHGWVTTEEGHLTKVKRAGEMAGHIIVQEMMIAANAALARYAAEHGVPVLFRNHEALAGAPDRAGVAALLADATASGGAVAWYEEVVRTVGISFQRAEYGVEPIGHYGLNLPSYLHGTSPLRRYADLVSQRQLLAHALGEPLPYDPGTLAQIAQHINSTLALERDARSAREKERATDGATRMLAQPDAARGLDGLDMKDFERVVKTVARSGEEPPEPFVQAYLLRLADHRLSVLCGAVVLLDGSSEGPGWTSLRQEHIAALGREPHDAVSILTMAPQLFPGMPTAVAEEVEKSGPPHAPRFRAVYRREGVVGASSGASAAEARQRAAVVLLAALAGVEAPTWAEVELGDPSPAPPPAELPVDGADPISVLQEIAQKAGAEMPVYSFATSGQSHTPIYTCTCSYRGQPATATAGPKKQDAKRAAAQKLVAALAAERRAKDGSR